MKKIDLGQRKTSKRIDDMFAAIDRVSAVLVNNGIKVWFNGTFGVAGYYGCVFDEPNDVDCGVRETDFDAACKMIETLGYKKIEDKANPKFKVSVYDAGGFHLEIGTYDRDLGDRTVSLEGHSFRVPDPHWFAECYRITAQKER